MGVLKKAIYDAAAPMLGKAKISETEKTALEESGPDLLKGFFTGRPSWDELRQMPSATLTDEEQAFIENKGNELASRANEWEIKENKDLPDDIYDTLKNEGWWGMIADKEHGGLGFSSVANSESIIKLSSVSPELGVTFMVPNSLGPIEVLEHFGTEDQKEEWLPKLTSGETVPCFALTSLNGGSDAFDGMENRATVTEGEDGKLKLNIDKISNRYITLAPLKGVAVLAFKLKDPEEHLGKGKRPGVTLALLPLDTPGVEVGNRHNPMGMYFQNGTVDGKDVVIDLDDNVIGGRDGVGQGTAWLMQLLGAGRGISLPALSASAGKLAVASVGRYARVRKQFGASIGDFEGIEEKLANIGTNAYTMDAVRRTTLRMIQAGQKPTVASAVAKVHMTQMMKEVVDDGMSVMGGAAVMNGPHNILSQMYQAFPIAETVEGANIMTENLIIFGQGMMVDHPNLYNLIKTAKDRTPENIDEFYDNVKKVTLTSMKNFMTGKTSLAKAKVPDNVHPDLRQYYDKVNETSASFALTTVTLANGFQDKLKFEENVTRRMGQVMSHMYNTMSVLEDFYNRGSPEDELDLVHAACQKQLHQMEESYDAFFRNTKMPDAREGASFVEKVMSRVSKIAFATARSAAKSSRSGTLPPSDDLNHKIARILSTPNPVRERMTQGIYMPQIGEKFQKAAENGELVETQFVKPLADLIEAENAVMDAEPIAYKLRKEVRTENRLYENGAEESQYPHVRKLFEEVAEDDRDRLLEAACNDNIITAEEKKKLQHADDASRRALSVDVFTQDMKALAP